MGRLRNRTNDPDTPLPPPDAAGLAVSHRLLEHLRTVIADHGGAVTFETFMEAALYAPGLGYYRAGAARFGAGGDFATAPELTPLFGQTLARQVAEILDHLGGGEVVELGPGTGRLAADALAALDEWGQLPQRWRMVEVSAALRQEQQRTLAEKVPHLLERVEWLDALPADPPPAVWLANEVLDALPIRRFVSRKRGLRELGVTLRDERLEWVELDPDPQLSERVAAIEARLGRPFADGYTSECSTRLAPFLAGIGAALARGVVLWIDYGYPQREYYFPERRDGTLICHYRHHAHADPFRYPGLQDITAFVDFTAVADALLAAELDLLGYAPQGPFLVGAGLAALAEPAIAAGDPRTRAATAQAIHRLTHPGDMGERFKVMVAGRGYDGPISGLQIADRRGSL